MTGSDYLGDVRSNIDADGKPFFIPNFRASADDVGAGVPFYRPVLHAGNGGYGVQALQLEMHSQLGTHAVNTKSGAYDNATKVDVAAFYKAHNHAESADIWDYWGWDTVAPQVVNQPAVLKLLAEAQAYDAQHTLRAKIVAAANFGYAHRMNIRYAEVRPYPPNLAAAATQVINTDCSGFATLCYKMAGAPDPNGRGYDGYGYTGTLFPRGRAVTLAQLQPGDLTFYGSQSGGVPSHTAVYIGNGLVISNGHYPASREPTLLNGELSWRGGRSYVG